MWGVAHGGHKLHNTPSKVLTDEKMFPFSHVMYSVAFSYILLECFLAGNYPGKEVNTPSGLSFQFSYA